MTARVRVYLPTYQRRDLLPRAVESLRAQTVTDWICELHNDDPSDQLPANYVRGLGDSRVQLFQHDRNLGPVATFNLFYRPIAEPFSALLEDDNTWAPSFLSTLLTALERHPNATLAWCNQGVRREELDGTWRETNEYVNRFEPADAPPRLVAWGGWRQVMGAMHANGAMLLRSRADTAYPTPAIPFGGVEAFRERLLPHPLIYVPAALATFSVTRQTARQRDSGAWSALRVALAATYVRHAGLDTVGFAALWHYFRAQHPPMTNELIGAALVCPEARPFLAQARPRDWLRFVRSCARHPCAWSRALRVRRRTDWWEPLDRATAARFIELRQTPNAA